MSEKDVKPKVYYIVDSSQLNNQPTRVYNTEPKWLIGAVEWTKVIELEPTLQLMKEMCAKLLEAQTDDREMIMDDLGYPGFDGPMSILTKYDDVIEKYRKFLEWIK